MHGARGVAVLAGRGAGRRLRHYRAASGPITVAQVGVLWFHVEFSGVPAHAARASHLGFNAIDAAVEVLAALRRHEAWLNENPPPPFDAFEHPINLNPGVISGGDWPSTVAATCTLSCRIGLYPGQGPEEARAGVEAAVAEAVAASPRLAENPPRVRYDGFSCEGSVVDVDEPLVQTCRGRTPGCTGSVLRLSRRRPRRMRAISYAWGYPPSASGRGGRGSTASTSASRCAPSSSPRRCSGSL